MSVLSDTSILVTGGCGFIGSHLVEALVTENARVAVLDNLQAGQWSNLRAVANVIHQVEGDVRDSAIVKEIINEVQPNYVFHLAANASVPRSVEDPAYDFETSCQGTFNLLNALRTRPECKKVIIASSGAVYGQPVTFPICEDIPLRPISPYGAGKVTAEVTGRMFHTVYNVPVVIGRIFNTYGPRMARFVVLDLMRKLLRDPSVLEVLGTGKQIRDFTYVSDTVSGLFTLAKQGTSGEAYNISSGTSHTVSDLARKLITVLGIEDQTHITYTGQSWIGDAQRWEVSIEKIEQLGYKPQISLDDGLLYTVKWFQTVN